MKHSLSMLVLLLAAAGYAHAQSDVFLCVDANGTREYKNTGATKGCKKIDLPPLTIAAPVKRAPAQTASARSTAAPADFPRVDSAAQQTRDNDRKQILQSELKREEQKLDDLRKSYNNGEPERQGNEHDYAKYQERVVALKGDIGRSEKNVEALKRELGNLR